MLARICLAPGCYLVRTLHHVYEIEELSTLSPGWIPMCLAGTFFALWVVEGAHFDYVGDITVQTRIISDATLFAWVLVFAFRDREIRRKLGRIRPRH